MKKKFVSLMAVVLVLGSLTTPVHAKTRSDYVNVEGTVLYTTSSIPAEVVSKEVAIYNRLDPGIKQALTNVGIRYYLINEANDDTKSGHTGTTVFEGNGGGTWDSSTSLSTIYSEGRMGKDLKYNGTVMNHEFGHVVDALYDGGQIYTRCASDQSVFAASSTAEWTGLYEKYKSTIAGLGGLSRYEVYDAHEAFAEVYGHYAKNPSGVRSLMPEVADYIDGVNENVITYFAPECNQLSDADISILEDYAGNSDTFNALTYYNRYADLQVSIGANPYELYKHYIEYGQAEGRSSS